MTCPAVCASRPATVPNTTAMPSLVTLPNTTVMPGLVVVPDPAMRPVLQRAQPAVCDQVVLPCTAWSFLAQLLPCVPSGLLVHSSLFRMHRRLGFIQFFLGLGICSVIFFAVTFCVEISCVIMAEN